MLCCFSYISLLYFLLPESWAEAAFNYFLFDSTIKINITSQSTLCFGVDRKAGSSRDCGNVDHGMQERGSVLPDSQII